MLARMTLIRKPSVACTLLTAVLIAGCGSSAKPSNSTAPSGRPTSRAGTPGSASGALAADARSAATGDIPDNQRFLVFTNRTAGYSIKYPEGWTQTGSGRDVTFRDKNNLVRVLVAPGPVPTPASVTAQLNALKRTDPTLTFRTPQAVHVGPGPALKAVYSTESAPDPTTGKRVKLIVDRYELASSGHTATVDLGTPEGVDNVDAYRMMIESFRWL